MTRRLIAVLGVAACSWVAAATPARADAPPVSSAPSPVIPASPVPSPPAPASSPSEHPPVAAVPPPQLARTDGSRILGQKVSSLDGQDLGRIVDVLVGPESKPVAAVIDIAGFMGLGSRKVAVEWPLLRFPAAGVTAPIAVALPADQIRSAPEYKADGKPAVVVVQPPSAEESVVAAPAPAPGVAAGTEPRSPPAPADPPPAAPPGQATAPR